MLIKIGTHHVWDLLAIADSPSFDEAARRVRISQPSLQRAANGLEHILEHSLYLRTPSDMNATRPALELARRLGLAMREAEYDVDEIKAVRGIYTGRLTISAIPLAGVSLLELMINDLLDAYPLMKLEIRGGAMNPCLLS